MPALSLQADGTLAWSGAYPNGVLTIERSSGLVPAGWLPYENLFTSSASGAATVPLTNSPAFFRTTSGDASTNPPGMMLIPAGYFQMGNNYDEGANVTPPASPASERPLHRVYVSKFYIGKYEVTNQEVKDAYQWAYDQGYVTVGSVVKSSVTGSEFTLLDLHRETYSLDSTRYWSGIWFTNSFGLVEGRENQPCIDISWYGAAAYCNFRSQMEGLDPCFNLTDYSCDFSKNGYRLPTEAEWEKAARGGQTGHHYPWISYGGLYSSFITTNMANYTPPTLPHPFHMKPVGYYDGTQVPAGPDMVNGYGLYDTAGNAREWCYDWFAANWYSQPGATEPDPIGPANGDIVTFGSTTAPAKVTRGGSFDQGPVQLRVADRSLPQPPELPTAASWYNGFRIVRRN